MLLSSGVERAFLLQVLDGCIELLLSNLASASRKDVPHVYKLVIPRVDDLSDLLHDHLLDLALTLAVVLMLTIHSRGLLTDRDRPFYPLLLRGEGA